MRTAQFETLLNQAPLGVYLVDADFRIREVNPDRAASVRRHSRRHRRPRLRRDHPHPLGTKLRRRDRRASSGTRSRPASPTSRPNGPSIALDRGVIEYYEWRLDRIHAARRPLRRRLLFPRHLGQQVQARRTRASSCSTSSIIASRTRSQACRQSCSKPCAAPAIPPISPSRFSGPHPVVGACAFAPDQLDLAGRRSSRVDSRPAASGTGR